MPRVTCGLGTKATCQVITVPQSLASTQCSALDRGQSNTQTDTRGCVCASLASVLPAEPESVMRDSYLAAPWARGDSGWQVEVCSRWEGREKWWQRWPVQLLNNSSACGWQNFSKLDDQRGNSEKGVPGKPGRNCWSTSDSQGPSRPVSVGEDVRGMRVWVWGQLWASLCPELLRSVLGFTFLFMFLHKFPFEHKIPVQFPSTPNTSSIMFCILGSSMMSSRFNILDNSIEVSIFKALLIASRRSHSPKPGLE